MTISRTLTNGLLVLTLDEPERRNPIGHELRRTLVTLLFETEVDRNVKAVVLTGAGGHLSAGGDIREQNAVGSIIEARDRFAVIKDVIGRVVRFPKPLVSAVEGWAAGGGFSRLRPAKPPSPRRSHAFIRALASSACFPISDCSPRFPPVSG